MSKKAKKTPPKHLPMPEELSELGREILRRHIRENHGAQFLVAGSDGVVINPHERKIAAILTKETGRLPIFYTMPIRNGKREFRSRFLGRFQLPEISFTDKSDP